MLGKKHHKSTLSQTQINASLLVKGAPLAIKSQNFNQGHLKKKMQDGDNQLKMREEETDAFSVRSDLEDDNIESTEKIDNIDQAEAAEEQQTS